MKITSQHILKYFKDQVSMYLKEHSSALFFIRFSFKAKSSMLTLKLGGKNTKELKHSRDDKKFGVISYIYRK